MDARSIVDLKLQDSALREALRVISEATRAAGGRALLVGGCVRDSALGIPAKDLDIEIYGLLPDHLVAVLSARFAIDIVGQSFGVIKIRHLPIDVSIPHRDSKSGLGREGFGDNSDPWITPVETASRRDFTINAVALDPLDGEVIDPYGGLLDLRRRILRHSSMKFLEDPLRVLRGMQFVARFNLQAAPETVSLCRTVGPEGIARERIFEEWRKLVVLGLLPSLGLQFLRDCGWVRHFPELEVLIGCPQDPGWHPEGDVWTHTLHSMDAFAQERVQNEWEDLVVGLATLCHDFGKPATTELDGARVRSIGHERAGEMPNRSFLMRLANQRELVESVVPLVLSHLAPQQFFQAQVGDEAIRRLARRVGRIDRLVRVAKADHMGRPPIHDDNFPAGAWLLERARELAVESARPEPLIMGRHLIEFGITPGPHFGPVLEACYEAQMEGKFSTLEEGIDYARRIFL